MIFKASDLNKDLSECQISRTSLIGLGEVATKAMLRFSDDRRSKQIFGHNNDDIQAVNKEEMPLNLNRRYERFLHVNRLHPVATEVYEMRESTRRKTIRKDKLSVDEIDKIIVTYKTEKLTQREIAVKFGVSARLVSSLVV